MAILRAVAVMAPAGPSLALRRHFSCANVDTGCIRLQHRPGLPNTSLCFTSASWISLSTAADYRPVSCSLVARLLSCQQRPSCAIEGTLPNRIRWLTPTVNHCSAHETWSHAVVRCSTTHHGHYGLLPLPVAPSQDAEMARPRQVPFRFAPTTRPGPLLLKNSGMGTYVD